MSAVIGIDDAPSREVAAPPRGSGREPVTVLGDETSPARRSPFAMAVWSRRGTEIADLRPLQQPARPAQLAERRRGLRRRARARA